MLQSKDTYICILSPLLAGNVGEDGMCHVTHVWVMWGSTVTCTCHMPMRRLYGPQSDWLCCSQNVLQSECVAVRMCCSQTVLQSECVAVRLCCSQTVLQSECVAVRLCCSQNVLQSDCVAVRLCCSQNVLELECVLMSRAIHTMQRMKWSLTIWCQSLAPMTLWTAVKMCSCSSKPRTRHSWSRRYVKKVPFLIKRALSSWQKSHIFSKCVLARARQGKGTYDPGGMSKKSHFWSKEPYLLDKRAISFQNVFLLERGKEKALMIQEVCQKSPVLFQKSSIFLQKSPT